MEKLSVWRSKDLRNRFFYEKTLYWRSKDLMSLQDSDLPCLRRMLLLVFWVVSDRTLVWTRYVVIHYGTTQYALSISPDQLIHCPRMRRLVKEHFENVQNTSFFMNLTTQAILQENRTCYIFPVYRRIRKTVSENYRWIWSHFNTKHSVAELTVWFWFTKCRIMHKMPN